MDRNAKIRFRNQDYEIFWHTEYCQHVLENHAKPTHAIDFRGINQVIKNHTEIKQHKNKFRIYGKYNGVGYLAIVVFSKSGNQKKCIVITCYEHTR